LVVLVAQTVTEIVEGIGADYAAKYGFSNPDEAGDYFFKSGRGVSHEVVEAIAEHKNEPAWMRKVRHICATVLAASPCYDSRTSPPLVVSGESQEGATS